MRSIITAHNKGILNKQKQESDPHAIVNQVVFSPVGVGPSVLCIRPLPPMKISVLSTLALQPTSLKSDTETTNQASPMKIKRTKQHYHNTYG